MNEPNQHWLTVHAAQLIVLGLLTGGLVAAAMSGQIDADPHTVLASHLNALLGAFWVLGVAWSLPQVNLSALGLRWMCWCLVGAQYANWGVTAVKAFLRVAGVGLTTDASNNLIFAILNALVVLPSLAAAVLWLLGLRRRPAL